MGAPFRNEFPNGRCQVAALKNVINGRVHNNGSFSSLVVLLRRMQCKVIIGSVEANNLRAVGLRFINDS